MPLPDLVRALERDTEAEVRAILAAGEAQAAQLEADGARARADLLARDAAEAATQHQARAATQLADVARASRHEVLAARAAMLARLREAVDAALPHLLAADPRLGASSLTAALACADAGPATLRCAPTLLAAARAAAPPTITVVADPEVATGVVLELASGTRVDATLATLLAREWPRLACEAIAPEPSP